MICINKDCKYRCWNSIDNEGNDLYYCSLIGIEVSKGLEECLDDRFTKEVSEEFVNK